MLGTVISPPPLSAAGPQAAPWHPLPPDMGTALVVPGFMSTQACQAMLKAACARGFQAADSDYPPSYRNNARQVHDDPELAARLLVRLQACAPAALHERQADGSWQTWALDSVNPRFRLCRYGPGEAFHVHQDGVHHRGPGLQSRLTLLVYLNDGEAFTGGDTLFYPSGPDTQAGPDQAPQACGRVRPSTGSLLLFAHDLWHAGATVHTGAKFILRSDVLYKKVAPARPSAQPAPFEPGHEGYVWCMASLPGRRLASGGRDGLVRLWDEAGRSMGSLAGHSRSVLGLTTLDNGALVSVSRDRSLRWWDLASGQCTQAVLAHQASPLAVLALPGAHLATSGADGLIKLWTPNGQCQQTLGEEQGWGWIWALCRLNDHQWASASESGRIGLWRQHERGQGLHASCQGVLTPPGPGPATPLRCLTASPDGQALVSGDLLGRLQVWQGGGDAWVAGPRLAAHRAAIRQVRFVGPDVLATASEDGHVRWWHWPTLAPLHEARHPNFVTDVLPLPGGRSLSCAYDGRILMHEAADLVSRR